MKDNDGLVGLLVMAIVVICICVVIHMADTAAHGL